MDVEVVEPLNICADSPRIEAIAMLGDGVTYAFSGMWYSSSENTTRQLNGLFEIINSITLILENRPFNSFAIFY